MKNFDFMENDNITFRFDVDILSVVKMMLYKYPFQILGSLDIIIYMSSFWPHLHPLYKTQCKVSQPFSTFLSAKVHVPWTKMTIYNKIS